MVSYQNHRADMVEMGGVDLPCGAGRLGPCSFWRCLLLQKCCIFNEKAVIHNKSRLNQMVEMGGVEPPSESVLTGTSPGADGYLHSLVRARAVTLRDLVASSCMAGAKLCRRTFTTNRRPIPGRGTPGWNAR